MTDGTGLLQAILDEPGDDGLRLIYADWLEDNGRPERAEFIRAGVGGQKHQCVPWTPGTKPANGGHPRDVWPAAWWAAQDGLPGNGGYIWKRGFVHTVCCTMQAWLGHGPAIVRAHPVERVEVTDCTARRIDLPATCQSVWMHPIYGLAAEKLPARFFSLTHKSDAIAADALSAALLLWAKLPECDSCSGGGRRNEGFQLDTECPDCGGAGRLTAPQSRRFGARPG